MSAVRQAGRNGGGVERSVKPAEERKPDCSLVARDGGAPRKPYEAPRVLSVETLEAVATICDGTGGYGKSVPTCQPGMLAS